MFKETSQKDAYICGQCCNKLSQVSRLQEQLLEQHSIQYKRSINALTPKSARLQAGGSADILHDGQAEECDAINRLSFSQSGLPETDTSNLVQSHSSVANSPDIQVG